MNNADKSDAEYSVWVLALDLAECTTAGLELNTQGYHRDNSKRQGSPNKPTNIPTVHIDPPRVPQDQPPLEWVSNQTACWAIDDPALRMGDD